MRTSPRAAVPLASLLPIALVATGAVGCSSPGAPFDDGPGDDGPLGTSAAAITAADAISRAEAWVAAKLLYCQSPNGADDSIDPSCAPVCMRTSNPAWDPYRSDCSGLVSWAWGLPPPGRTTAEFAPNQDDITSVIQASDLAMGDAACTDDATSSDHHIILFKAWTVPGQEATFIEEPGCSTTPDYAHEFTSAVTLSGTSITVAYEGMTFTAIRYGALAASPVYAASYVSQTWPLSSAAPIAMTVGRAQKGSIDLMNSGTATWKAGNVKLAPIPRDQPSAFAAPSWLSETRVSTIAADVPPGGTGHFEWDLDPAQAGSFQPYFGLVAEGITWFADSGGPPDDDIQVNVQVAPDPSGGAGGAGGEGDEGGSSGTIAGSGTGGGTEKGAASAGTGASAGSVNATSGCQASPGQGAPPAIGIGALVGWIVLRRRRRG